MNEKMSLETVKSKDYSLLLKFLERDSIFDADSLKLQIEWLITQAEKVEELMRLAKIGEAFEYFMTSPDVEEYVVVSIGKREYDTIEDVMSQYEAYKEWQK